MCDKSLLCLCMTACLLLLVGCDISSNQLHSMVTPAGPTVLPSVVSTGSSSEPRITLTVNKPQYGIHDAIYVTVTNTLGHSVYLSAIGTNCSPLHVERQMNNSQSWQLQGRCLASQTTRTIRLPEGRTAMPALQPPTPRNLAPPSTQATPAQWLPGTYRVALFYQEQPDPDMAQGGKSVESPTFSIS